MTVAPPTLVLLTGNSELRAIVSDVAKNYNLKIAAGGGKYSIAELRRSYRRYDIVAIDKWFSGNARLTAKFVRELRAFYKKQIVALDVNAGNGDIFSVMTQGCNFSLPDNDPLYLGMMKSNPGGTEQARLCQLATQLCGLTERIAQETAEQNNYLAIRKVTRSAA